MDDARVQLTKVLGEIYKKTGIRLRTKPEKKDETSFSADFYGKKLTLYLDGTGEETNRLAALASYLIANVDLRTLPSDCEEFAKSLLLGEGSDWDVFRFVTRYGVPSGACVAFDVLPDKCPTQAYELVKSSVADTGDLVVCMDKNRFAVVCFIGEEQNTLEFGQFLWQSLYEELGVRASIGVGCEAPSFSEISISYHQAVAAVRMAALFENVGEVHSYREYLLVKMLEELPVGRLEEHMTQFRLEEVKDVFSDKEIASTAEAFLECDLNVSEASRKLFMHRNTLTYRLDKIERTTGLDIRKFADAVTFRVLSVIYRLSQK